MAGRRTQNPTIPPSLAPQQAIPLLKRQLERLELTVISLQKNDPDVEAWENTTTNVLNGAFGQPNGETHPNTQDFLRADSGLPIRRLAYGERTDPAEAQERYRLKQKKRAALLRGFIEQLEDQVALAQPDTTAVPIEQGQRQSGGKVFFGHGRSHLWRELKDLIVDRLHLDWDEFNRESAAGRPTTQRLNEMLANAVFAFLVLTAEDEHADGSMHARESVVHEVGLFQGKLGFERAIIMIEEGCTEFSNIHGLTQIRFPKGDISAKFEEVRKVLEREGVIASGQSTASSK